MTVQQLFNKQDQNSNFKAVNNENTFLTDEEKEKVLTKALSVKIAEINSVNYLKVVSQEPKWIIPTFDDLYETLSNELIINHGWDIDEYIEPTIKTLCYYFSGDEAFELIEDGYSHKKGILIIGPVGCGKTTLLKVFQKNSFNPFRFTQCRTVASEYAEFGQSAIKNNSFISDCVKRDWFGHSKIGMCYDDLGTESEKKNFGNQLNVMAEIILNRYDNSEMKNKTHFTTNLTPEEIATYYGLRANSRMREMLNIIEIPFDAPDRRK